MDFFGVVLTSLFSIAALFVITKMMGHKQVAQLDFFDYITGITIGSIGAELATELEAPWKPFVAIVVYGAVSTLLNFVTHKISKTRKSGAAAVFRLVRWKIPSAWWTATTGLTFGKNISAPFT